jgi:glycosyltransferase involved in cell wall biosynthesis
LIAVHPTTVEAPWLRVLFVTSMWPDATRPYYGPFVRSQAQSIELLGVGVDVLAIRGYVSQRAYLAAVRALYRLRRGGQYQLTHVHTGHAAVPALTGVPGPMVISYVGGDLLGNPDESGRTTPKSRVEAMVFKQLARVASATITKSVEMQEALPRGLRARNHVIPNGVDLAAFAPQDRAHARRSLGWDDDEPVVLFLGDPSDPRKNVALARAAVAALRTRRPEVRLHIGWGATPAEIPNLMWAADALVFSSRSEGSPNVVKEAMAATLPIVATPVGDIPERLVGVDGCFVVAEDAEEFAQALELAVDGPRSIAAREAVASLSLEAVADQIVCVYETVTAMHRGSPVAA